jgi:hypothetical protein
MSGKRKLGLTMLVGYAAGVLGGWLTMGQDLVHFGAFFSQGFEIARGYNETMCFEFSSRAKWTALLTAVVALSAVIVSFVKALNGSRDAWHRLPLLGWLFCLFFIVWKHGVGRAEPYHLNVLAGFMPILALSVLIIPQVKPGGDLVRAGLALTSTLAAMALLDTTSFHGFAVSRFCRPFGFLPWNAQCLLQPTLYYKPEIAYKRLPKISSIVGRARVDMFGCEQACVLLNRLNYQPRPVFQTIAAYTRELDELNERFYLSNAAPDFIVFHLAPADGRFPPLEDSMVFRDLLINYQPIVTEEQFILLKSTGVTVPKVSMVREGDVPFGGQISLAAEGDANLWFEIDVEPTFIGSLLRFVYKPPPLSLWVWPGPEASDPKKFLAPRPMLAAGFVGSPLLLENQDVQDFYAGSRIVRPKAYSVVIPPGTERFWRNTVHYKIFRIENCLGQFDR